MASEPNVQSAEEPSGPRVLRLVGRIAAVGLEEGRESVALRVGEDLLTCDATPAQVEQALAMRHGEVQAIYLESPASKRPRLLRIDPGEKKLGGTPEQRWEAISTRWDRVLAELAK